MLDRDEAELRELARLHVRAALRSPDDQYSAVVEAIEVVAPTTDARILARAWLVAAARELAAELASSHGPTSHDRFAAALAECRDHDIVVVEGEDDLAVVRTRVEAATPPLRGVLWFGEAAVWHSVTHGVLEIGLRHPNGAPARDGDPLVVGVVSCLERHGVPARWNDDHLEARVEWAARP